MNRNERGIANERIEVIVCLILAKRVSFLLLTPTHRVRESQNRRVAPKGTRNLTTHYSITKCVKSLPPKLARMVTQRVPFGELNQSQRTSADSQVNRKRRECPSRRFFVFPSLSCGLRHTTPCRRCLCFAAVPFGVRKVPVQRVRFGSKLSDSLAAEGRRVNRPFPFGVLNETRELKRAHDH